MFINYIGEVPRQLNVLLFQRLVMKPEKILEKKQEGGRTLYRVKWQAFPIKYATWQSKLNLNLFQPLIDIYEASAVTTNKCRQLQNELMKKQVKASNQILENQQIQTSQDEEIDEESQKQKVRLKGKQYGRNQKNEKGNINMPKVTKKGQYLTNKKMPRKLRRQHKLKTGLKIYHLSQIGERQHLYLVEDSDGKLSKRSTNQLIHLYPEELVEFLEMWLQDKKKQ